MANRTTFPARPGTSAMENDVRIFGVGRIAIRLGEALRT